MKSRANGESMSRTQTVYSERASYMGIPGVSQRVRGGKLRTPPPPVPVHAFVTELELALNAETPSGLIALDLGPELAIAWRATTPSLLATYLCMQPTEAVESDFVASAGNLYFLSRQVKRQPVIVIFPLDSK